MALFFDCDDFQRINEIFGNQIGDASLRAVGKCLLASARKVDQVSRIGGDEFLVLLPDTLEAEAYLVAERCRASISRGPIAVAPVGPVSLTVSVGVAKLPREISSIEDVLSLSRPWLRKSKARGKNCVSGSSSVAVVDEALSGLLRCIENDVLFMKKLPIVRLPDETIIGHEMLVRAPPPLESPSDLFGLAAANHVITKLDVQCLRTGCRAMESIAPHLQIHLNILPSTLLEVPIEQILPMLRAGGDRQVCLEIGAQQFIGDPAPLAEVIKPLKDAGIRIAIDDVGSGHGSLDHVLFLEPHLVKIDLHVVRGIARDPKKQRLYQRLFDVATALGAEVMAEGVESRKDLSFLRTRPLVIAQGSLWM